MGECWWRVRGRMRECVFAKRTPTHLDGLKSKAIRTIRSPSPCPPQPLTLPHLSIYLLDFIGVIEESVFDMKAECDIRDSVSCHTLHRCC